MLVLLRRRWIVSNLIYLGVFLNLVGCGGKKESPLEQRIQLKGATACDEVKQMWEVALAYHLTKTEKDRDLIYGQVVNGMLDTYTQVAEGLFDQKQFSSKRKKILEAAQKEGARRLNDCKDIQAVNALYKQSYDFQIKKGFNAPSSTWNRFFKDPTGLPHFDSRFAYWTSLDSLADNLDSFAHYDPPNSTDEYRIGIRTDVYLASLYDLKGSEKPSLKVLAADPHVDSQDVNVSEILPGDRITHVQVFNAQIFPTALFDRRDEAFSIVDLLNHGVAGWLNEVLVVGPYEKVGIRYERSTDSGVQTFERIITADQAESSLTQRPIVAGELKGNIIYVRLFEFGEDAAHSVQSRINALYEEWLKKNPGATTRPGIILDLRYNGGGSVSEVGTIAGIFLPEIVVGKTRRREIDSNRISRGLAFRESEMFAANLEKPYDFPLAVLINNRSASASDILAMILKDSGRALIVGERSFGKGIGQIGIELGNFSTLGGTLFLTAAQFFGLSGDSPQIQGVEPQLVVRRGPEVEWREACATNPDKKCGVFSMQEHYDRLSARDDLRIKADRSSPMINELPSTFKAQIQRGDLDRIAALSAAKPNSDDPQREAAEAWLQAQ